MLNVFTVEPGPGASHCTMPGARLRRRLACFGSVNKLSQRLATSFRNASCGRFLARRSPMVRPSCGPRHHVTETLETEKIRPKLSHPFGLLGRCGQFFWQNEVLWCGPRRPQILRRWVSSLSISNNLSWFHVQQQSRVRSRPPLRWFLCWLHWFHLRDEMEHWNNIKKHLLYIQTFKHFYY